MRLYDAPTLGESNPYLTLPAAYYPCFSWSLEFQSDAGEVAAKGYDMKPLDGSSEVCGGPGFAEYG